VPDQPNYGLTVEFTRPDGGCDATVVPIEDVLLGPFDAGQVRAELLGREVEFPQGHGLGHGRIVEVFIHEDADDADPVVTFIVRPDPADEASSEDMPSDFTRSTLRLRKTFP
jgi:hypothetical protein